VMTDRDVRTAVDKMSAKTVRLIEKMKKAMEDRTVRGPLGPLHQWEAPFDHTRGHTNKKS
jgi:hypothetical protein